MSVTQRLLVVLAHPDDESFAIGGTLARYAAEHVLVTLVCATRGEAGIPGLAAVAVARLREGELRAAARVLGIGELHWLGHPDGALARAEPEPAIQSLVTIMRTVRPTAVITFGPDGISGHPDHIAIHQLATAAFDRAGLVTARLLYIAPSEATQQGCGVIPSVEAAGGPVVAIDIGPYRVAKVRAMQCHASQNPPYLGRPEHEAERLVCHEYFTIARPLDAPSGGTDLFATTSAAEAAHATPS